MKISGEKVLGMYKVKVNAFLVSTQVSCKEKKAEIKKLLFSAPKKVLNWPTIRKNRSKALQMAI